MDQIVPVVVLDRVALIIPIRNLGRISQIIDNPVIIIRRAAVFLLCLTLFEAYVSVAVVVVGHCVVFAALEGQVVLADFYLVIWQLSAECAFENIAEDLASWCGSVFKSSREQFLEMLIEEGEAIG